MSEHEKDTSGVAVAEERLVEALRPHRPDAEDFLRGVRERVEAGERAHARARQLPPWLRSAAALLPPGLLREEALGLGAGLAAKPAGWGAALLVAPAVAILALFATFVASLRAVRGLGSEPLVERPRRRPMFIAQRGLWIHAVLIAYLVAAWLAPGLALWVMAASMALFAVVFARLEREGLASRALVGGACAELLTLFALYTHMRSVGSASAAALVPMILAVGGLACALPRDRRAKRTWASVYHVGFALFLCAWILPSLLHRVPSLAEVEERLESPDPPRSGFDPGSGSATWRRYALTVAALERAGAEVELAAAREGLHARLDAREEVDPYTRMSAARLGLLRPDDWAAMVDERSAQRDVAGQGSIPFVEQRALALRAYERAIGFTPSERAHLAARLVASVPAEPKHGGIATALAVTDALLEWGAEDELRQVVPRVRAHLVASFEGSYHDRPAAAFASGPKMAREHSGGSSFLVVDETLAALELVERVGVPPETDLGRVARFLDEAAREASRWRAPQDWHLAAAAGLHALEARGIEARSSAVEVALLFRQVLPAALLALFCLFATLRAAPAPAPAPKRAR